MEATQQLQKTKRVLENSVYKAKVSILKTSAETGGSYSLAKLEVSHCGDNSLHFMNRLLILTLTKGALGVM